MGHLPFVSIFDVTTAPRQTPAARPPAIKRRTCTKAARQPRQPAARAASNMHNKGLSSACTAALSYAGRLRTISSSGAAGT
ncbi:hypothetical protein TSOC_011293 [Tetrabaena socialis]|uniref:Uncharacterized protein n=1 Tax=Tetrabaena socialis TaxID=47790 RepID=A0A2J7ZR08_9CHLO|nr:hypothetical protein TSOC_011293 [Tetrabaena socialis]|eukprot:PNH02704.1 hypothetical protein TSOC_011293 [Tetrabaena socialis]